MEIHLSGIEQLLAMALSVLVGAAVSYGAITQRLKHGDERMNAIENSVSQLQRDVSSIRESIVGEPMCLQLRTQCQAQFIGQLGAMNNSLNAFKEATHQHQLSMQKFMGRIEEHFEGQKGATL